jgi:DNA-binding NarL/FixJ family response regulator
MRAVAASVPTPHRTDLTARELEVLRLIAAGRSTREISSDLDVAEKTVKTHVSNILMKLGFTDRTQAAVYAVREGLAHPP